MSNYAHSLKKIPVAYFHCSVLEGVIDASSSLWGRFGGVFCEAVRIFDAGINGMAHAEGDEVEDVVKGKINALKRAGKSLRKTAKAWNTVCAEEEKHVRSTREWWRKDWTVSAWTTIFGFQ